MKPTKNADLRNFITEQGLKLCQVAEILGMSTNAFSLSLSHVEFSEEEHERIKQLIRENVIAVLNAPPKNYDIRKAIEEAGLKNHQVASLMNIKPAAFSRILSKNLTEDKKAEIFKIIKENAAC